jgi:hypothetical protein
MDEPFSCVGCRCYLARPDTRRLKSGFPAHQRVTRALKREIRAIRAHPILRPRRRERSMLARPLHDIQHSARSLKRLAIFLVALTTACLFDFGHAGRGAVPVVDISTDARHFPGRGASASPRTSRPIPTRGSATGPRASSRPPSAAAATWAGAGPSFRQCRFRSTRISPTQLVGIRHICQQGRPRDGSCRSGVDSCQFGRCLAYSPLRVLLYSRLKLCC